jgi:hypothetical protein
MTNVSIAKQYREIHGWEMPTLKLARIMYKENNLRFSKLDNARSTLRAIENKTKKTKIHERLPDRPKNPYNLPESDETVYEPYKIKGVSRLLVLSDIHIPYHSIEAVTTALDYAKNEKPDGILLNGDAIDFFQLSRYCKEPGKRSFAHELAAFKQFVEILQSNFSAKLFFKLGNHEERYNHFLWMKAGELDGLNEFKLEEIIKARAEGIEVPSAVMGIRRGFGLRRVVSTGEHCFLFKLSRKSTKT